MLTSFAGAVESNDLIDQIDGPDPVTVFAPDNATIAALPNGAEILADPVAFDAFLRSQTVAGSLTQDVLLTLPSFVTVSGDTIVVDPAAMTLTGPSGVTVRIVVADAPAVNGVVQIVDGVFVVPAVTATTTT